MLSEYRRLFPITQKSTYLNTAAESPLLSLHNDVLDHYLGRKMAGTASQEDLYSEIECCRQAAAAILDAESKEIGFMGSTSEAISSFISSIPWSPGDNVVLSELEHAADIVPCLPLARKGVEIRVIKRRGGIVLEDDLVERIDWRTRAVVLAYVSHWSGYRHSLDKVKEAIHRNGGYLILDATQAFGVVPVDLSEVDFLTASSYKWLLGFPGIAVVYLSSSCDVEPLFPGWRGIEDFDLASPVQYSVRQGARGLERGYPNFLGISILRKGIELIGRIGISSISSHVEFLCNLIVEGLCGLSLEVITPNDPQMRAGIAAFRHQESKEMTAYLRKYGIYVTGGEGRVRVSCHFFNNVNDVEHILSKLRFIITRHIGR